MSFIGYRPLGQCANVARSVATSAAASVFFFDAEPWRVLYIYFFANVIGAILASLAYWLEFNLLTHYSITLIICLEYSLEFESCFRKLYEFNNNISY